MVRRAARTVEHVTLIVRPILDGEFRRDRRDLRGRKLRPPRLAEIAKRQQGQAVTGLAYLVIDLEAALQLPDIESAERAGKRPRVAGRLRSFLLLRGGRPRQADETGGTDREDHGDRRRGLAAF
jgi:hypothetical protein